MELGTEINLHCGWKAVLFKEKKEKTNSGVQLSCFE